ncbi:MAG: DUF5615 family PIN-like protein [Rhodospirillales bacterium]|nr:DUF5615 family PIN-like protein [Rhodospirillales bacterium]
MRSIIVRFRWCPIEVSRRSGAVPQARRSAEEQLKSNGHDAVHVRDLGLSEASDPQIVDRAI